MEEATITSKGQVTIPRNVRKAMELKKGEKIIFISENDRFIILKKPKNVLKHLESLRSQISFTQKEIDEMMKESKKAWSELK